MLNNEWKIGKSNPRLDFAGAAFRAEHVLD